MKAIRPLLLIPTLALTLCFAPSQAQDLLTAQEVEAYRQQAEGLVRAFEYTLNVLGSTDATAKEKDIIINQSYTKFFKDEKVQIEDDLDETREMVANKDVQAYLKDVDFFFREATFEFNIESVDYFATPSGQVFFRVTTSRNLQATTLEQQKVNNSKARYFEINLNRETRDLKIASLYTTRLSEAEELSSWWSSLTFEWQAILRRKLAVLNDTLTYGQLKTLVEIQELDLSKDQMVLDLTALSRLTQLQRLNVSETKITDIIPLRNLTKLQVLQISKTLVADLSPLRYCYNLKELHCEGTLITDLEPVKNFVNLEKLYCGTLALKSLQPVAALTNLKDLRFNDTPVMTLDAVSGLTKLETIRFSETRIENLGPLSKLSNLERIYMENTPVKDLSALQGLKNLKQIFADNVPIQSLQPLNGLPQLERVYCDKTLITRDIANRFMASNPKVLVIFDSDRLLNWWTGLPAAWKAVFSKQVKLNNPPTKEDLQTLANISNLNVAGNQQITSLDPLKEIMNLRVLDCSQTPVNSLEPLKDLFELQVLKCAKTAIPANGLSPLKDLANLREVDASGTAVAEVPAGGFLALEHLHLDRSALASLSNLAASSKLQYLYIDSTRVPEADARKFALDRSGVLVVFRTAALQEWWKGVPDAWKAIFTKQVAVDANPTREQLHRVTSLATISIEENSSIASLDPLRVFVGLKELQFSNTRVSDLTPIGQLTSLEVLACSRNPVSNLAPLAGLANLRVLNVENTPVASLAPLVSLKKLEDLKCSGTQIRDLKPVASLINLKHLECFNTGVKALKPLNGLPALSMLVVYNTKLTAKSVDAFKKIKPNCEVVHY